MNPSREMKMLSGAPGSNLSQAKSFLTEDSTSKFEEENEDPLLAKTLSIRPSTADDFPPSYEGDPFLNPSKAEFSHLSQIKWECPPSFALNSKWCVATGEESREKIVQSLREMRGFEAVYPGITVRNMECYGDILTPDIPLIPVEEQASVEDKHDDTVTKYAENELQTQLLQQYIPLARSSSEVDLFAAYATVAAAIMKRNEEQCLIDTNFLLETVNDPIKIGNLIQEYISTTSTFNTATPTRTVSIPTSCYAPATSSVPLTTPASKTTPFVSLLSPTPEKSTIPSVSLEVTTLDKPVATAPLTKPASTETETTNTVTKRVEKPEAPLQNQRQEHLESDASSVSSQRCVKDVNYYMNLVNDPDDNKKDMRSRNNFRDSKQSRNNTTNPEEEKFKIHKPCKYFKTSRGCRNGSNCRYEHERSVWRM